MGITYNHAGIPVPRSGDNVTDSVERTGADGVGGALNDYADESSATVTINGTQLAKYLVSTSEAHTADTPSPVQIGDWRDRSLPACGDRA